MKKRPAIPWWGFVGPLGCCSPPVVVGAEKVWVMGNPDMNHCATSYVERQNLTMRMHAAVYPAH